MDAKKKLMNLVVAAAAVAFVTAPITSTLAQAAHVKCYGTNACKGKSECKTAKNACKGQNSCKGEGYKKMSSHLCKKDHGSETEPTS